MSRCPLCARSFPPSERFCPEHALPLIEEPSLEGRVRGELTGTVLENRYLMGGILGSGGMGTVYDGRRLRTNHVCAVKVLLGELQRDPKMRRRLYREIQACSEIRHPGVVEIIDYGDDPQAGAYLVMELLSGRSLENVVAEHGALPLTMVFKVVLQLCGALGAIHSRGLLHCDLKPSNIHILPDGRVKVLDFGLVKPYDADSAELFMRITSGGMTYGTPHYMSPEQASFGALDPRSDMYSLGVVLYEMLLGAPPFGGNTPVEVIDGHRSRPVPLPSEVNPNVVLPAPLEVLLLRLLHKEPEARPGSVAEVAEALDHLADSLQVDVGAADLTSVAGGAAPAPEPTRPLDLTLPLPATEDDFDRLREVAESRQKLVVDRVVEQLRQVLPRYRSMEPEDLRASIRVWVRAFLDQLGPQPPQDLPAQLERILDQRSSDRFSSGEVFAAFWLGLWACRPIIREVAGGDVERFSQLDDRVERRVLPLYLKLAERYVARFHLSLARQNELLATQNEELLALRNELDTQLRRTHANLAETERVKARVTDSISSGLVLIEMDSLRVKLFNKTLERYTGLSSREVLGRPITDIFHLVEGVPFEEFAEQVRDHGQVGLRKLKVRFPSGTERTIYVQGQPYLSSQGQQTGVLFVIEDVTEREKIIESFSRYVTREVAQRILRRGSPPRAQGEHRRAVLMAVGIPSFRQLLGRLSPEDVVVLLDQYVRCAGNAVFHRGGVIDAVVGDCILIYFANRNQDVLSPVQSAAELRQRMVRLNRQRASAGQATFEVAIGLQVGEVLLVNVGGRRRMVHTVLGEPAEVARALQAATPAGDILLSAAMARQLGEGVELEEAPPVTVEGQEAPVAVKRVVAVESEQEPEDEDLDPPTLT